MIPFAIMLLVIAVAPLAMERIWEKNLTKLIFTLAISVPTAIYMIYIGFGEKLVDQIFFDYLPFIVLLGSLFVVTGGIRVSGDVEATPVVNTLLLATGFLIASFMGTTGAAMLMIRPLLSINSQRAHKTHTVMFFIALVANCGGVLTPLGDPPLFLLYLRGAPFGWFMHLVTEWLFVGVVLLTLYALLDWYYIRKESAEMRHRDRTEIEPIRITGCINFLYLAGIIASVACINESYIPAMGGEDAPLYLRFLREINSPNVEIILDPVNLLDRNNYKDQEKVIDNVFKYYGDRVSVMHIKDFKLDENGDVAFEQVGEGLFNYAPLFKHLKEKKPHITMLIENSNESRYHSDCEYLQKIYDEA